MINLEKSLKLKKEINSLRPLNEDDKKRVMQKFRLNRNYHSNNMEGNALTYDETKSLILFGITAQDKNSTHNSQCRKYSYQKRLQVSGSY